VRPTPHSHLKPEQPPHTKRYSDILLISLKSPENCIPSRFSKEPLYSGRPDRRAGGLVYRDFEGWTKGLFCPPLGDSMVGASGRAPLLGNLEDEVFDVTVNAYTAARCTELFKMTVGVLTTCHTQYT
jgi:hypothetical protein